MSRIEKIKNFKPDEKVSNSTEIIGSKKDIHLTAGWEDDRVNQNDGKRSKNAKAKTKAKRKIKLSKKDNYSL